MAADRESPPAGTDALAAYRAKRSPDRTPEPFSGVAAPGGRSFVVHKHAARNMHFDLRLEWNGVLLSWAVPRGPSYDMADKRLAVHVEDHPLEYGEFEGVIPAGNYGAGGVIQWDRGEWVPLEDIREGFEKGKLLFELRGHKLRGNWTLVKIKKGEKEWLLIKERDGYVKSPGDQFNETSVKSGLTVEEVRDGVTVAAKLRNALPVALGEAKGKDRGNAASLTSLQVTGPLDPRAIEVQLAEPAKEAFTRDGWIFELKLDGYRILASKVAGEALLLTRNGNDYTEVFPEVARAVRALPIDDCIVDGEVVVLDADGRPSFSLLQRRGALKTLGDVRRLAPELPATFYAFDLIAFDDVDLRNLPLIDRKALLRIALPSVGPIRVVDHIEREGVAYLAAVERMNLEGIIAKKADAPYRGGRSKVWCKIKAEKTGDFVIVGYTASKSPGGFLGALQLADYVKGDLVYAGRVGTGFSEAFLKDLFPKLVATRRPTAPCRGPIAHGARAPSPVIPETKTTTWVEPALVCEVRYREWTPDGLLRHAAFRHLRDDKNPGDCQRQDAGIGLQIAEQPALLSDQPAARNPEPAAPEVLISNPKKIYWPDEKYTKSDLIEYYRSISPWLLPYLRNRPVVMTRYPDGIDGKSFYQKDAPDWTPEWVRTTPIWSEDTQKEIRYFVADDLETITYLANLGTIPLHMWLSRVGSLEQPDVCVIDLDPKEAPFRDVVRCALVLRKLCEDIGMPHYVKTTGKSGLHVMLPLGRQCTYEQSRMLGQLLAEVMLRELSDIATITRHIKSRGDKVYLDFLQNRHGQLIVTPYSVRPLPKAPVSMPLLWSEVNDDLDPRNYTIRNALDRMEELGRDPVLPALDEKPNLGVILDRLSRIFAG